MGLDHHSTSKQDKSGEIASFHSDGYWYDGIQLGRNSLSNKHLARILSTFLSHLSNRRSDMIVILLPFATKKFNCSCKFWFQGRQKMFFKAPFFFKTSYAVLIKIIVETLTAFLLFACFRYPIKCVSNNNDLSRNLHHIANLTTKHFFVKVDNFITSVTTDREFFLGNVPDPLPTVHFSTTCGEGAQASKTQWVDVNLPEVCDSCAPTLASWK